MPPAFTVAGQKTDFPIPYGQSLEQLRAEAPAVLRLVLGQAVQLVAIGVATGLAAAAALTRLLERLLFEVGPFDPWTFSATALLLVLVGTVASYVPARRCLAVALLDALRTN